MSAETPDGDKPSADLPKQHLPAIPDELLPLIQSDEPIRGKDLAAVLSGVLVEYRQSVSYRGPHPSPEMMQGYREAGEDVVQWIMQASAAEQESRHSWDKSQLELQRQSLAAEEASTKRAQYLAFAVIVMVMAGCVAAIALGQTAAGLAAIVTALATLVASYLGRGYLLRNSNANATSEDSEDALSS